MNTFNLNVLIVEDNLSFALELEMLLDELNYNVIGRIDNSAEALETIFSKKPDLIFMDIEIKGNMSGVEVGQTIAHLDIPILYITSRQDKHTYSAATQSNMIGYLVKPIEKVTLKYAIQSAIFNANTIKKDVDSSAVPVNDFITDSSLYFKKKDTYHKVFIDEIAFVKSDDNYCIIRSINGADFTARITLSKLEKMLPADKFLRTHRQYIVQSNMIEVIDFQNSVLKIQGIEIPINRTKRKEMEQHFKLIK